MAVKKLTFSFDLPVTTILGLVATGHADLRIDAYGDDKVSRKPVVRDVQKLLEAPKKPRNSGDLSSVNIILKALASEPKATKTNKELGLLLIQVGRKANSVSPQLTGLRQKGLAKRVGGGTYQVTPKGVEQALRLGLLETAHG